MLARLNILGNLQTLVSLLLHDILALYIHLEWAGAGERWGWGGGGGGGGKGVLARSRLSLQPPPKIVLQV